MDFIEVASLSELRESKQKFVNVGGDRIALFFLEGRVYAINAICPHRGGYLDEGEFDDEEIICPIHAFMFNVKTGACLNSSSYSVKVYKVKVDGDIIKIWLE